MGLGSRPATGLEKALEENYGVKIWYMELEHGSAASTIGHFGPAILMNRSQAPWRRSSNFAHELFHLVTWKSLPPTLRSDEHTWNSIERKANSFAACLLLPAEDVKLAAERRIDPTDNTIATMDLIQLAREFGVSTQMLFYRLQNLNILKREDVDSLLNDPSFTVEDKSTMHDHWWEPPEYPERFVRLAFTAYKKGNLSRAKLAEYLNTSLLDLTEELKRYDFDDTGSYDAKVTAIGVDS